MRHTYKRDGDHLVLTTVVFPDDPPRTFGTPLKPGEYVAKRVGHGADDRRKYMAAYGTVMTDAFGNVYVIDDKYRPRRRFEALRRLLASVLP